MARPERPEPRVDRVASRGEVMWRGGVTFWKTLPIAARAIQRVGAQAAEQYIVGRSVLGMQLQAVALKHLGLERSTLDLLAGLVGDRVTEHRQPTIFIPV